MRAFPISTTISSFASQFHQHGYTLYIVGGAVRDFYLNREQTDYDFTTDATPDEMKQIFKRVIPTGIVHGTVTILYKGHSFEVTTFRHEGPYSDFRRPDSVSFVRNLEEDLGRRDFTINALAIDAKSGTLTDLHGGISDIYNKVVRAIGDPFQRFSEDALRIMRACRFSSQLAFTIEKNTFEAMSTLSENLQRISGERIRVELMHILSSPKPSVGIQSLQQCGALKVILPELEATIGVEQGEFHLYPLYEHSLISCDAVPSSKALVRLSALLHDIGKVETKKVTSDGKVTFYNHEQVSVSLAKEILQRLKFSNKDSFIVLHLIKQHMFHYEPSWSDGAIRRFINRVGLEYMDNLFELRKADRYAINHSKEVEDLIELHDRIAKVLHKGSSLTIKDLDINGYDLMQAGIPKGEAVGLVLKQLLETVLDDPKQNNKEQLLKIAKGIYTHQLRGGRTN